jgi:hypothetical protein
MLQQNYQKLSFLASLLYKWEMGHLCVMINNAKWEYVVSCMLPVPRKIQEKFIACAG